MVDVTTSVMHARESALFTLLSLRSLRIRSCVNRKCCGLLLPLTTLQPCTTPIRPLSTSTLKAAPSSIVQVRVFDIKFTLKNLQAHNAPSREMSYADDSTINESITIELNNESAAPQQCTTPVVDTNEHNKDDPNTIWYEYGCV